jgi:hypothetical protein
MGRYVLEYQGEILVRTAFKNIKEARASRLEWAAELGGAIGNVRERQIKIIKLVELKLKDRRGVGSSSKQSPHSRRLGRRRQLGEVVGSLRSMARHHHRAPAEVSFKEVIC